MSSVACRTCKSTSYKWFRGIIPPEGPYYTVCSDCSNKAIPSLSPDVYFDSKKGSNQTDPNICHRDGTPIPFSSKREKAAILKGRGLREAGDKVHGSRNFDRHSAKQWENQ